MEPTYALPHVAVQARIELTRVYIALADLAGARTLMREVDCAAQAPARPGNPCGEAGGAPDRPSNERGKPPGSPSLTAAEFRLLPTLATHLSFPEIADELFLSPHTIKSEMNRSTASSGSPPNQAVTRSRELGPSKCDDSVIQYHQGDGLRPGTKCNGVLGRLGRSKTGSIRRDSRRRCAGWR